MINKYFYFIAQVKKINAQHELTGYEIALLDFSAQRYFSNTVITAGELIRQGDIASQATLNAALKSLINKKLLTTIISNDDGRVKKVVLTKLALQRYKQLDLVIRGASRNG
jgi:DNA-binding MarR family transcriptional regulator